VHAEDVRVREGAAVDPASVEPVPLLPRDGRIGREGEQEGEGDQEDRRDGLEGGHERVRLSIAGPRKAQYERNGRG
jgi:hypothetical protein